ncbi:MAG: peptide chain release factor H [Pseudomonadota bacterium]
MLLMQISAGQGPVECCLAVSKTLKKIEQLCQAHGLDSTIIETTPGPKTNTLSSVLLGFESKKALELVKSWEGTIQWVFTSPYRSNHRRKNWFVSVCLEELNNENHKSSCVKNIRFQSCYASGPGGQHVNKTRSAVIAVHEPTGVRVKIDTYRSQHQNKRLAIMLIEKKLSTLSEIKNKQTQFRRRMHHYQLERGNPVQTFNE